MCVIGGHRNKTSATIKFSLAGPHECAQFHAYVHCVQAYRALKNYSNICTFYWVMVIISKYLKKSRFSQVVAIGPDSTQEVRREVAESNRLLFYSACGE